MSDGLTLFVGGMIASLILGVARVLHCLWTISRD